MSLVLAVHGQGAPTALRTWLRGHRLMSGAPLSLDTDSTHLTRLQSIGSPPVGCIAASVPTDTHQRR